MRLRSIYLKNFRSHRNGTLIPVQDLTAFIGKNDTGKSSILEALEIFFNNTLVKIEGLDKCIFGTSDEVEIGCAFDDLPESVVLDEASTTRLQDEFLLNQEGFLEIRKVYQCSGKSPKESVYAYAVTPQCPEAKDLLLLKNPELKKRLKELKIDEATVDLRSNPAIRAAIYRALDQNLEPSSQYIQMDKEDAKRIWESLEKELPTFALFQADRPSKDEDPEVQDPMKVAVNEAIKSLANELAQIKTAVQAKTTEVAVRTLEKLKDIDPTLATELSPNFKAEPKWNQVFTMSLTGDDQIPINKRGSGVRRLVLFSFFRAEAERKHQIAGSSGVIYAVEEPETSQHPLNQRMIIEALLELSQRAGCQVILTTHVPALAGYLPIESLRYVTKEGANNTSVVVPDPQTCRLIAAELGVLPDNQIKLLACVEGPTDIDHLKQISKMLNQSNNTLPDLSSDPRVLIFPLGGSTLKQWVENNYLRELNKPEVHIYDRGTDAPPQYSESVNQVNARNNGSYAVLTGKREIENYLHPDAIAESIGVAVTFGDNDNVPETVARALYLASGQATPWNNLNEKSRKDKISRAKSRLSKEAVVKMTAARLATSDPNRDLELWLHEISNRL